MGARKADGGPRRPAEGELRHEAVIGTKQGIVIPRHGVSPLASPMTGSDGESSMLRLLGPIADVSGILDRPVPATPRLRRGFAVLARRSFSEGGKPGDDDCVFGGRRSI